MSNKMMKSLFAGIFTLALVFSTYVVALAAGDGNGKNEEVTLEAAYLTTITGDVSSTGGDALDGNTNVATNPLIKLVFNKNMKWDHTSNAITLTSSNGNAVDIQVYKLNNNDERNNIFVSPKEALKTGKTYTLNVEPTLTANNGNPLAKGETITFTVAGIDEDLEAAQQVDDLISALPDISALTLADKALVMDARKAYDDLTDEQKEFVTNLEKLSALEAKMAELEADAAVQTPGTGDKGNPPAEKNSGSDQKPDTDNTQATGQTPAKNTNETVAYPKTGDASSVWAGVLGTLLFAAGLVMIVNNRRGKTAKSKF